MLDAQRAVAVGRPLLTKRTAYLARLQTLVLNRIVRLAELRADVIEALLQRGVEVDARVLAASLDPVVVAGPRRVATNELVCNLYVKERL